MTVGPLSFSTVPKTGTSVLVVGLFLDKCTQVVPNLVLQRGSRVISDSYKYFTVSILSVFLVHFLFRSYISSYISSYIYIYIFIGP